MIPELSASKVAAFIGLNQWQSVHETMYDLFMKDKDIKARIQAIEREHNRQSYNKVVGEVLRDGAVQGLVQTGLKSISQAGSNVQTVLGDVEENAKVVMDLRMSEFSPELRNRLASEVRGQVMKQRGINNEDTILNNYEAARAVKLTNRNTKTAKKDFGAFKLVGRCDGYVESAKRIIDAKERTKLWAEVPIYDEIQLRAYMIMYDANESELVERFPNGTTRTTLYANDVDKWATIETAIRKGVAKMNSVLEDAEELKRIVFANTVNLSNED
jgi:hypothetical protein